MDRFQLQGHQSLRHEAIPCFRRFLRQREALERWAEHHERITILLTDIVMPGMLNGHDLADRLLEQKPLLRVITMSGYDPAAFAGRRGFAGVHLRKPFVTEDLLPAVGGT